MVVSSVALLGLWLGHDVGGDTGASEQGGCAAIRGRVPTLLSKGKFDKRAMVYDGKGGAWASLDQAAMAAGSRPVARRMWRKPRSST